LKNRKGKRDTPLPADVFLMIVIAQESPESGAENAPRLWQIISGQWPDQNPRYFATHLI
jgi:hypothetical protein